MPSYISGAVDATGNIVSCIKQTDSHFDIEYCNRYFSCTRIVHVALVDLEGHAKFQGPSSSLRSRIGLTSSNPFLAMSMPCTGKTSAQGLLSSLHSTLATKIVYELCDRRYQRTCWDTEQPRVLALCRRALDGKLEGKKAFG